jgi:hypothetical protein
MMCLLMNVKARRTIGPEGEWIPRGLMTNGPAIFRSLHLLHGPTKVLWAQAQCLQRARYEIATKKPMNLPAKLRRALRESPRENRGPPDNGRGVDHDRRRTLAGLGLASTGFRR